jgi:hypothetical protein
MKRSLVFFVITLLLISIQFPSPISAQTFMTGTAAYSGSSPTAVDSGDYDIGTPILTDLWVDPAHGDDAQSGNNRQKALRTLTAAWGLIPSGVSLSSTGFRMLLAPGVYQADDLPVYMEDRHGDYRFPVVLQAADGPGTAILGGGLNIFNCQYLYLIGLNIVPDPAGDALHFERCNHVLLRSVLLNSNGAAQETLKANQCSFIYVEECDISGSYGTALDFVAVQYGHIVRSRVHQAGDWCIYLKGGSAYFRIEGNELFDGDTGGFTAGQGTGFEFMESPWLHYETYDIKFINNLVHDTNGAGMGVNGSYNTLLAFNTLYRVGQRSHAIEVVFGLRGCDGDVARCQANLAAGGWGTARPGPQEPVPNRNVFIYNNIVYNPPGFRSQWSHFAIQGPRIPSPGTNIPSPAATDTNLQVRGNIIFNGPPNLPLGVEEPGQGAQPTNPTCNAALLLAQNAINTLQPQLVNPAGGDYRPVAGSNVLSYPAQAIPDFTWNDVPHPPVVPPGQLTNSVTRDRNGSPRTTPAYPGALQVQDSTGNKWPTRTTVTSSINPSVGGQAVTFTANVVALGPAAGTPTGSVTFNDGTTLLGGGNLQANQVQYTTSALVSGSHAITAVYTGDAYFDAGNGALTQAVNPQSFAISTAALANAEIGIAYYQSLTADGGIGPCTWSITGSLPQGLSLSGNIIRGIPRGALTTARLYTFTVQATDSNRPVPQKVARTLSFTLYPALSISTSLLPAGYKGIFYSQSLQAGGGSGVYGWSILPGSLPEDLNLNSAGLLSGTPAKTGAYALTFQVSDGIGLAANAGPVILNIFEAFAITTTLLPEGDVKAPYRAILNAKGGAGPYTWSAGGGWPSGLSLSTAGIISGTPFAAKTYRITVRAKDKANNIATADLTLKVNTAVALTAGNLPPGEVNRLYPAWTPTASGGGGIYNWSINVALPAGLFFNASTGAVSGTPGVSVISMPVIFTIRDNLGGTDSKKTTLTIYRAVTISTTSLKQGSAGISYSAAVSARYGCGKYAWSLAETSNPLPNWASLNPVTGVIASKAGSRPVAGSWTFTVRVTDSLNATATQSLKITIK